MAISAGKPEHGHMKGHSGKQMPGAQKSESPVDYNPSGYHSQHEKM